MHTRRMATFLLGAWLGCSLLIGSFVLENLRSPIRTAANATPGASKLMQELGDEQTALLLRFQALEENRTYLYYWEVAQVPVALALGGCLLFGTEKRLLPLLLCGTMLILVLFQHLAVTPEMTYQGREADFPPGNKVYGTQMRLLLMEQSYVGVEAAKLVIGGVLASYLFVFRTTRRSRRRSSAGVDVDARLIDG